MRIVSKTDVGKVRRNNQDAYATGELPGGVAWAVVCDGMGGANGGNIASATAVKVISERISSGYRDGMSSNSILAMLDSAINAANISVFDMSQEDVSLAGMGTTVVTCVLVGGVAYIGGEGQMIAVLLHNTRGDDDGFCLFHCQFHIANCHFFHKVCHSAPLIFLPAFRQQPQVQSLPYISAVLL